MSPVSHVVLLFLLAEAGAISRSLPLQSTPPLLRGGSNAKSEGSAFTTLGLQSALVQCISNYWYSLSPLFTNTLSSVKPDVLRNSNAMEDNTDAWAEWIYVDESDDATDFQNFEKTVEASAVDNGDIKKSDQFLRVEQPSLVNSDAEKERQAVAASSLGDTQAAANDASQSSDSSFRWVLDDDTRAAIDDDVAAYYFDDDDYDYIYDDDNDDDEDNDRDDMLDFGEFYEDDDDLLPFFSREFKKGPIASSTNAGHSGSFESFMLDDDDKGGAVVDWWTAANPDATLHDSEMALLSENLTNNCTLSASCCNPEGRVCTLEVDPVCGCDGVTYSNACSARFYGCVISWTPGECS